jgi:hypothetical protein
MILFLIAMPRFKISKINRLAFALIIIMRGCEEGRKEVPPLLASMYGTKETHNKRKKSKL